MAVRIVPAAGGGFRTVEGDVPVGQNPDGSWRTVQGDIPLGLLTGSGPGYLDIGDQSPSSFLAARLSILDPLAKPGGGTNSPNLGIGGGILDRITNRFFPTTPPYSDPFLPGPSTPPPTTTGSGSPCDLLTGTARTICLAAGGVIDRFTTNKGTTTTGKCPAGYTQQPDGSCKTTGVGKYLPGDVGAQDAGWNAVNGRYGAGLVPIVIAQEVMRCPAGYALGKDNICYDRIARTNRKHNPGAKPLFTGGDMNALRRAKSLKKKARAVNRFFPAAPKPRKGSPIGRKK